MDPSKFIVSLRYLDDIVAFSRHFCGDCVLHWLRCTYPVSLLACSGAEQQQQRKTHTWTDVILYPLGSGIGVLPKNPNREWIHGVGPRDRTTMLRWAGRPPAGFSQIRSSLISRLQRCQAIKLPVCHQARRLLEDLLEYHSLPYPPSMLRALAHCLPLCPAIKIVRRVVRL